MLDAAPRRETARGNGTKGNGEGLCQFIPPSARRGVRFPGVPLNKQQYE